MSINMLTRKIKIGDLILIKSKEEIIKTLDKRTYDGDGYQIRKKFQAQIYFSESMFEYCGKVLKVIPGFYEDNNPEVVYAKPTRKQNPSLEDVWWWHPAWIEEVNTPAIKIFYGGNDDIEIR